MTGRTPADEPLEQAPLPRHPKPSVLAAQLRRLAKQLERDGKKAEETASLLAARGWPPGVNGGTSRSADQTTSVERAAGVNQERTIPTTDRWADIDHRLAALMRLLWKAGLDIETIVADLLAHGDDADQIPSGTGACQACDHLCKPRENPNDRLRAGLCGACYKAWERDGRPPKSDWAHRRSQETGDSRRDQGSLTSVSPTH